MTVFCEGSVECVGNTGRRDVRLLAAVFNSLVGREELAGC